MRKNVRLEGEGNEFKLCVFFLFCTMVLSALELDDFHEYIGEYESVNGFRLEWALNDTDIIREGSSSGLENGVYERYELIGSSRFTIEKKTSNKGGFRLNIREEGNFIFLPNMMIVSESMIMDDDIPDGIGEYQYVLYRKVILSNGK